MKNVNLFLLTNKTALFCLSSQSIDLTAQWQELCSKNEFNTAYTTTCFPRKIRCPRTIIRRPHQSALSKLPAVLAITSYYIKQRKLLSKQCMPNVLLI